jgi:hypothetical protein
MKRVRTLISFFTRALFRSLAGVIPLAAALAFGIIAFEYGMDQPQFITVAGVGIGAICLLTTLLLSSRANRASTYLIISRLRSRSELLLALVLSGTGITGFLALLITVANQLTGRLNLDFPSALWIVPTWLALWLMASALALPLSALAGRGESQLLGYAALSALLLTYDRQVFQLTRGLDGLTRAVDAVLWPVSTLLSQASSGVYDRNYFLALAATIGYAALLFVLAAWLFIDKDLLWTE